MYKGLGGVKFRTMDNSIFLIVGILIIILLTALVAGSFYFYNVAIKRSKKEFLMNNKDLEQIQNNKEDNNYINKLELTEDSQPTPAEKEGVEWVESQKYETWNLITEDGLKLTAYYIAAKVETNKTVILAHGYTSRGKDMGSFAKFYYEKLDYNVLMPDDRGHGNSEGNYIGFGWPDRKDYVNWIRMIVDKVGVNAQIVLHGISMGGATVMMVSGEALPKQVKAIVEDCGYTSVYDELQYQLKRMYHLPSFPILHATSLLSKIRAGYYFKEATALNQVQKNKLPMLFIHGDEDTFVPTEMVWKLYDACTSDKDIYIVKGAGHGMAYGTDKLVYEQKVTDFLSSFIN
jgi:fermentation-respiration switch protein FrsA (DUF1100 family)